MVVDYIVNLFYKWQDENTVVDTLKGVNFMDYNKNRTKNIVLGDKKMSVISGKINKIQMKGLLEKIYNDPITKIRVQLNYQEINNGN